MKLETVKYHEQSRNHQVAKEIKKATVALERALVVNMILAMWEQETEQMSMLFCTVHAFSKSKRLFSDYEWLCQLDKDKGLTLGSSYLNEKAAKDFAYYISEVKKQKIATEIKQAGVIAVFSYGSTDSWNKNFFMCATC